MIENNAYQNMVTTTVASSASAFVPVLNNEDRDIYQPKRTSGGNNFYQKENVMDSNSRCYMTTTSTPSNSSSPTQTYRPQTDRMIPSFIEIPPQKENSNTYYNRYSPSLPSPSSLIWSNSQHQNEVSKPFISENTTTTPNTNTSYFGYNSPSYLKQMNGTTSPTENDYTNSQYHDKNKANFYTPYRTSYQTQQAQNNNIPFSSAHVMYPDQQFK
ncbi:uncharacterized protein B0P05DRAFT_276080 [Gilbertella persicaria]|uniref:uncharacterized protein n=1 Tax=Gilbertella persicaria TaxID=101096 RepID=UPI00221E5349|nr:uncharacterized protein B0P05DRAFT_276080 [Gilbertella persicaria]KAI8058927.1 hypothetical protein B0P05DRAFT_276080 [Gilbertella persicaria]